MAKKEKAPPLVIVEWQDAASNNSAWLGPEEAVEWSKEGYPCISVGWLVHSDKKIVSIASTRSASTGALGGLWQIPAGMVKRMKRLKS
jgi:hypothetical protein